MSRPLLITDCDEVLLHMVTHFGAWVEEEHGLLFDMGLVSVGVAIRRPDGEILPHAELWPLFDDFFANQMHRQTLIPHAGHALAAIAAVADIVVLTNLPEECRESRIAQLDALDIRHRVICNQGGKGRAVAQLIDEYRPSVAAFVDDLPTHHDSVSRRAPGVWRLHMIGEPRVAAIVPPAPLAHARIDHWQEAEGWILERFSAGRAADA
jgi:hypothetical protein